MSITTSPFVPAFTGVTRRPLCFGQNEAIQPLNVLQAGDTFTPQFAGKRLQKAKRNSAGLLIAGILLGGGTVANAALDAMNNNGVYGGQPGHGGSNTQALAGNLDQIAEYARESARLYVPPASGRVAPDAMLRQVFCEYITGISREVAAFNNASRLYLQPGNISHCYPETVFDPTEFSNLMTRVYQADGWRAVEDNYDEALRIVFGDGSTRISDHDKEILLDEARRAFDALEDAGPGGSSGGYEGSKEGLTEETIENLRKSKIMLALLMVSGALIGVGLGGRIVFGTADAVDGGIQSARAKRRVKKALKNLPKE